MNNFDNVMSELKSKLDIITDLIPKKSDIIYVDYPLHLNVGDLLIMLGTQEFFSEHQYNILLSQSSTNLSIETIENIITPSATIILHGGGNFGDLYPSAQRTRENIIKNFPNHKIIIFPQTIHFESNESSNLSEEIFKNHKDLHILARDTVSFKKFKNFSNNIHLTPDIAHYLWPLKKTSTGKRCLSLMRRDIEKSDTLDIDNAVDWDDITKRSDRRHMKSILSYQKRFKGVKSSNLTYTLWISRSNKVLDNMIDYFSSYSEVQTSRLHGHIFSCLLSLPNKVIDNSYGKNSTYFNTWTKDIDQCQLVVNQSNETDLLHRTTNLQPEAS